MSPQWNSRLWRAAVYVAAVATLGLLLVLCVRELVDPPADPARTCHCLQETGTCPCDTPPK